MREPVGYAIHRVEARLITVVGGILREARVLFRDAKRARRLPKGRAIVNLYAKLLERHASGRPIRIGLIGAGKFGAMYLHQVLRTPGVHLVGIADLSPSRARENLNRVGWRPEQFAALSLEDALKNGTTFLTDDWEALVKCEAVEVIAECTGNPVAAVEHCLGAFSAGKPVINVTVEADAFCGPIRRAERPRSPCCRGRQAAR